MYTDPTDEQTRDEIHALRYRQSSLPLSNDRYVRGLSSITAQKIWTTVQIACVAFGMLVLCCWWTLLMIWFNPTVQPPSSHEPERDASLFKACEPDNWSGLDVFTTLASLAFARVLQAPFAPPHHVWGIRLLLFSPAGVLVEMLWMWFCLVWVLATRRSFFATCAAVRMYRMRGLRPDISFKLQKEEADTRKDSSQCVQWNYGDTLNVAERKTSSKPTTFPAEIQKGNGDDPITADLIAVSQRRHPLLTCAAYFLMILQHYKVQSVTGAGFIKSIVFVYEIAFITTETIYLMPSAGASIADAANAMKAFFKDVSNSEANPFNDSVIALLFIGSAGGTYFFAVMAYGVPQLFNAFAFLFPEDITNSLALTTAIELAFKMLIIIPTTFSALGLAIALPFWIMTVQRACNALLLHPPGQRSSPGIGPVGSSWEWLFAPLLNSSQPDRWHHHRRRLRTAMLNYSGVILWSILFWNLVRLRDGKLPFVQHPDLAYNCSSTTIPRAAADSWLFLR